MSVPNEPSPPSTAAIAIATGILGVVTGYFLGQGASLGLFGGSSRSNKSSKQPKKKPQQKSSWPNSYDVKIHPDSSDEELMSHLRGNSVKTSTTTIPDSEADSSSSFSEDDDEDDAAAAAAAAVKCFSTQIEEWKMVLVVRTDLGMSKGKIAAQCAHATLACYKLLTYHSDTSALQKWEATGQAKVALQCPSDSEKGGEEGLMELQRKARALGLCAQIIRDAGRTQIAAGSATVLGVGPGPKSVVDQVTGGLKLL